MVNKRLPKDNDGKLIITIKPRWSAIPDYYWRPLSTKLLRLVTNWRCLSTDPLDYICSVQPMTTDWLTYRLSPCVHPITTPTEVAVSIRLHGYIIVLTCHSTIQLNPAVSLSSQLQWVFCTWRCLRRSPWVDGIHSKFYTRTTSAFTAAPLHLQLSLAVPHYLLYLVLILSTSKPVERFSTTKSYRNLDGAPLLPVWIYDVKTDFLRERNIWKVSKE
jgi:hypothetical protein